MTNVVKVGNVYLGGNYPILIQSMTNIKTSKVNEVVKQINELEKIGCEIIRVSVLDTEDAIAIKEIKKHISIPIVADIHFDYKLALLSADSGCNKLRINPGNIGSIEKIKAVVDKCKEKNIPIRIGVNSGSVEKELLAKYNGPTAQALAESALNHAKILEDLNFYNTVISVKASDIHTTLEAYKILSEKTNYPLHIGITESGTKFSGTIKSSVGLGLLLNEGIGDTIRVSLSTNPLEEIKVAKEILSLFGEYKKIELISCPTCGRTQYNMIPLVEKVEKYLETLPQINLKIAIMGCVVNGPGEARNADLGIAGGIGEAVLFKKGQVIRKIKEEIVHYEALIATTKNKKEIDSYTKIIHVHERYIEKYSRWGSLDW